MTTLDSGAASEDSGLACSLRVESRLSRFSLASWGAVRSDTVVVGEGDREWSGDAIIVERGEGPSPA